MVCVCVCWVQYQNLYKVASCVASKLNEAHMHVFNYYILRSKLLSEEEDEAPAAEGGGGDNWWCS